MGIFADAGRERHTIRLLPAGSKPERLQFMQGPGCCSLRAEQFRRNFRRTNWDHTYQGAFTFTSGGNVFPDPNGLKQLQAAFPNNPGVAAMTLNGPYAY